MEHLYCEGSNLVLTTLFSRLVLVAIAFLIMRVEIPFLSVAVAVFSTPRVLGSCLFTVCQQNRDIATRKAVGCYDS